MNHIFCCFATKDRAEKKDYFDFRYMVIEEIVRGLNSLGLSYDYYHYRTGGGAEVDMVLEGEFGLLPIEIKNMDRM